MIRVIFAVAVIALVSVLFTGCTTTTQVDCRLPEPPASLLVIPQPLPPVPADLEVPPK
jgi:hypothetical protein